MSCKWIYEPFPVKQTEILFKYTTCARVGKLVSFILKFKEMFWLH